MDPNHRRQGVGALLMRSFCCHVDENALDAFVMFSPAGVRLYSKFGFRAFGGVVETKYGNFTSMLRALGLGPGKNIKLPDENNKES